MADPRQKSLDLPIFFTRILPTFQSPPWLNAERWRAVVANQPVAQICLTNIIADTQNTGWEIRARDPKEQDELEEDIAAYTEILNPELSGGLRGFDILVDQWGQDLYTLPVGGNIEVVRWPDGFGPFERPHPKGHVFKLVFVDGATISPTHDREFPMMQRLPHDSTNTVFFRRNEIARTVLSPSPAIKRWGFGMAPPEKVFLAISLLSNGDQYYWKLLIDTPEAGLLDLIDMSRESAERWVSSFRELITGIDPMKIGVLYEHTKEAKFLSFGRPPTEMMLSETTLRYAAVTHAGYGLTLTDTGLGPPEKTLAGSIRDERRSRRSGYMVIKEKWRNLANFEILPPYLEFAWLEIDEETQVQKGRSFLLHSQALKNVLDAGVITELEAQRELVDAGHLSSEVEPPEEEEEEPLMLLPPTRNGNDAEEEAERVPAREGGRGDIGRSQLIPDFGKPTEKALELGDERIAAVPKDSSKFDQLAVIFKQGFQDINRRLTEPQMMRLIKIATRELFPTVNQAVVELSDTELPAWQIERLSAWFDRPSEFDEYPEVLKANEELLDDLEAALNKTDWWKFEVKTENIATIFNLAFSEGATEAAELAQQFLFTEGLVDSPEIIGLNFNLTNPTTLRQLERNAAQLVRRVDDGTKFFIKRIITSSVEEGLASPSIAQLIRDGAGVEEILRDAGYTSRVIDRVKAEVGAMSEGRTNSIVNTEIARAESEGRIGQWREMGLTRKAWMHTGPTGPNDPCPVCVSNIEQGFVPMDHLFNSVFGDETVLGVPAHPGVDHCHNVFDEDEMLAKAGELTIWTGS